MPNTPKAEAEPQWPVLVEPEEATRSSWDSSPYVTRLVDCGLEWDAVIITPLERGLAALTRLGLPMDRGYPVLADYVRQELIVHVPAGTARRCTAQGIRSLTTGSWLLMPTSQRGSSSATWLSPPHPTRPQFVDPGELSDALRQVDQTGLLPPP
ncbi:hypothetical protein GCM10017744_101840 [Streptomyces antimycoticus]|uniref:Uncharacterized protein n=1 Tax=Streptomyces antimycoticus TaxID=68175 RepID=A0A4D4KQM8_9ACTN|nr:hypothetical protein [Streptomyces antimycoticus]GDY49216.1 hypothetical protein SANT12839_100980 [Streptomyces antimycoticus]